MIIKQSFRKGLGFGLTSGIITTLGLIIGLYSVSQSKLVVIGGIITIAIADSLSDALGIHISEEFTGNNTTRQIWEATITTFLFKFLFSASFIIPVLIFDLWSAIVFSTVIGLILITSFSFYFASHMNANPWRASIEHLFITMVVIFLSFYFGQLVTLAFGQ